MYDKIIKGRRHSCRLWNACRTAFAAVTILLGFSAETYAQKANGLEMASTDPHADSLFFSQMRARMDSIRKTDHRPTVALVLSGGGAKGASQLGTLKMIEEYDIPIDFICGTSVGGLIGGVFSLGYNSDYIMNLFRTLNWGKILTDRVKSKYIPHSVKAYKDMFAVAIPFHYENSTFDLRLKEQETYNHKHGDQLSLGAHASDINSQVGINDFASSLPSGYAFGLNINNLISSLTVGYQDSISFADLPIPFTCVATDMVSCHANNWTGGSLKQALRSTMSIPGLFDPVRTKGMILVDGGTRNNFPTDIAKAAGADIIIGVDLSDPMPAYSQVNNLGDVMSQFITMLGKDSFEKNIHVPEVYVKPRIGEFNMLSFNRPAIDTMINRGYEAAKANEAEFRQIKSMMKGHGLTRQRKRAVDINTEKVQIQSITFSGLADKESRMLMEKIGLVAGQEIDGDIMEAAVSRLEASRTFDLVTYEIKGQKAPYDLEIACTKGPVHQIGGGIRMDTEDGLSAIFNLGLNVHKLMGASMNLTGRLGNSYYVDGVFALNLPGVPTVSADVKFGNSNINAFYNSGNILYNFDYLTNRESIYFSNIQWIYGDVKIGIQNEYFKIPERSAYNAFIKTINPDMIEGDYLGAFISGDFNTFDNRYYPRYGTAISFNGKMDFHKAGHPEFTPMGTVSFDAKWVMPMGRKFAVIPDLHIRNVISNNDYVTLSHNNLIGGVIAGRYLDHQIPFVGFGHAYIAKDYIAALNMNLRYSPLRNVFATLGGGYFRESDTFAGMLSGTRHDTWGVSLEVAYNSIIGPGRFNLCWSALTRKVEAYLSLGFDF